MKVIIALSLFCLFSVGLSVSFRNSKPTLDLSVARQAYDKGDYAAALKVVLPLATQGDPGAQNYLGLLYQSGQGVAQDYKVAVKWFGLSAGQGNAIAQDLLGGMYYYGRGVAQDYKEAAKWYRFAADQGNPFGQWDLGNTYDSGLGVPQDYKEAAKWFRLAADQGYPAAQNDLGVDYEYGQGVPQDYKEAAKWYRLAADQGNPLAQNSLGRNHEKGQGVPKDKVQAHLWYNLAAANGNAAGITNRDRIAQELTSVQLAEAQRLALEWTAVTESLAKYGARPATVEELRHAVRGRSAVIDYDALAREAGGTRIPTIPPPPAGFSFDAPQVTPVQSIQDAENKGLVRTSYRSPDGASSGDSIILIVVKISGPSRLALSIPSGLALSSPSRSSQSMIISALEGRDLGGGTYTPENLITLTDNKPVRYVIAAYCAEFHKDNPPPDKFDFQVAATPDPVLACILSKARKEKLSVAGTQAAVWIRTDHVTFPEMNTRMTVDREEWSKAGTIASSCNSTQ